MKKVYCFVVLKHNKENDKIVWSVQWKDENETDHNLEVHSDAILNEMIENFKTLGYMSLSEYIKQNKG